MKRKRSQNVELKIRMKEPLRAAIEKSAKARGVSMNSDAVERLSQSFRDDRVLSALKAIEVAR